LLTERKKKKKKEKEKKAYRIREQNDVIYKVYCKTLRSLWDPVSGEPVIKLFSKSGCSDWTTTGTRYDHFVPLTAHDDAHKRTFPLPVDLVPEVQFSEMPFSLDGETEEVRHQGMRNVLRFIQDKTAPNPAPVRPIPSVGKLDMKKGDEHRLTVTWMWYEFFIETIKKEIRKRRQSTQKNIKGNKSSLLHPPGLEA